jgi:hypothetical protein
MNSEDTKALVERLEIGAATYGKFRSRSPSPRLLDEAAETIRDLERQLAALQSDEWLPIDSAGFDHEWCVLGWGPGMDAAVEMLWREDMNRWMARGGGNIEPTHWRPLPTPPSAGKSK